MSDAAEAEAILAQIRPDNDSLVERWAGALSQVDGLYQEIGPGPRLAMARANVALLRDGLDNGAVPDSVTRKFVDAPLYTRQPLAQFVEAAMLVEVALRDFVTGLASSPSVAGIVMKQVQPILAAVVVRVVQLREARQNIAGLLADIGAILRDGADAREAASTALGKIAAVLDADLAVMTQVSAHEVRIFASSQPLSSLGADSGHVWARESLPQIARLERGRSVRRPLVRDAAGPEGVLERLGFTHLCARPLFVKGGIVGLLVLVFRVPPDPQANYDQTLAPLEPLLAAHLGFASQTSALDEADAAIRELFDASPTMLVALDRGGRVSRANNRFIDRIGIRDGLIGMPFAWLVHPSWLDRFQDLWRRIASTSRVDQARVDLLTTASTRLPVVLEAHWLESPGQMCLVAMTDVSEQVARQAESEQQIDDLTAFAHHVAHDLRHPLRTIAGFSAMLKEDLEHNVDAARAHADRIIDSARRGNDMITGLLEFARIPVRQHKPVEVPLSSLVRRAREHFEITLAEGHATLTTLPGADPHFLGDPTALQALVNNLIGNALQHGGRTQIHVEISAQPDGPGWAELWVRDDGVGIPAEDQARVFDVFVRGSSRSPGSGVGLAIVRRIAEAHGGRVVLDSQEGAGCLFRVRLPTA